MQLSGLPARFNIPWGASAGSSYIRVPPQPSQIGVTPGAASLTDGFPPICFLPIGGGGVAPFGQDFNGILNWLTESLQWEQAGAAWGYDATFSTTIGGYPKAALIPSAATLGQYWLSEVDNNTSNPDTGGANWLPVVLPPSTSIIYKGQDTSSTANAIVATVTPGVTALTAGMAFLIKVANSITGASTLAISGLSPVSIKRADLTAPQQGDILAGQEALFFYDGTYAQISGLLTGNLPSANETIFSTPGTTNWTVPAGVTVIKKIRAWGAGGGGAGMGNAAGGGGGGGQGGGYSEYVNYHVTPGSSITVIIGAGGTAGTNSSYNGGAGGTTSFGSLISITGGSGGSGFSSGTGGGGGSAAVASGGMLNVNGSSGQNGINLGASWLGGIGAGAAFGGGSSTYNSAGIVGATGNFPGGGGGGGTQNTSGGPGATGAIIIEY